MADNPFTKPFLLNLNPSLLKWMFIVIPHLIGLVVIIMMVLIGNVVSIIFNTFLFLCVIISLVYFLKLHIFQSLKKSVQSISQDSVDNWFLGTLDNPSKSVLLMPSSYVSKVLIILNYIDINKKYYSCLITVDSLSKDEFRRLRVRLKNTK